MMTNDDKTVFYKPTNNNKSQSQLQKPPISHPTPNHSPSTNADVTLTGGQLRPLLSLNTKKKLPTPLKPILQTLIITNRLTILIIINDPSLTIQATNDEGLATRTHTNKNHYYVFYPISDFLEYWHSDDCFVEEFE